jgi:hypothetical protein
MFNPIFGKVIDENAPNPIFSKKGVKPFPVKSIFENPIFAKHQVEKNPILKKDPSLNEGERKIINAKLGGKDWYEDDEDSGEEIEYEDDAAPEITDVPKSDEKDDRTGEDTKHTDEKDEKEPKLSGETLEQGLGLGLG